MTRARWILLSSAWATAAAPALASGASFVDDLLLVLALVGAAIVADLIVVVVTILALRLGRPARALAVVNAAVAVLGVALFFLSGAAGDSWKLVAPTVAHVVLAGLAWRRRSAQVGSP